MIIKQTALVVFSLRMKVLFGSATTLYRNITLCTTRQKININWKMNTN
jgi:hypothetical protein